jgi:DNA-directed RNA polymerase subunit omega
MLKLSVNDLVNNNENCYSFVVAIAKRARKIADSANDDGIILYEKPVQMAVKEYTAGKFHIVSIAKKIDEEKIDNLDDSCSI